MKKRSITLLGTILLIIISSMLFGCSKSSNEIKEGLYSSNEGFAHLRIEEDETFVLQRDFATSYAPTGGYIVDGDKLILHVNNNEKETIEFKISGDTLIFETGKLAENHIKKGTVFIYKD